MAFAESQAPSRAQILGLYAVSLGLLIFLWDSVLIQPLKVLVVMTHELGHALAALATGGEIIAINTAWEESGVTQTRGGIFPIISASGYLFTALFGSALIFVSHRPGIQRGILAGFGAVLAVLTLWHSSMFTIAFYLGILGGAGLVALALRKPGWVPLAANFLGSLFCLYSLFDLRSDLAGRPKCSDAGILARWIGIEALTYPIAGLWILMSVGMMGYAFKRRFLDAPGPR